MRRLLMVLTLAALMAAMVVTAGPAKADTSIGGGSSFDLGDDDADGFDNDVTFISFGSSVDDFDPGAITVTTA